MNERRSSHYLKLVANLKVVDMFAHDTGRVGLMIDSSGENEGSGTSKWRHFSSYLDDELKVTLVLLVVGDGSVGPDHWLAVLA